MEKNMKDYDTRASWIPQQNQPPVGTRFIASQPQKMPKARVLALTNTLKKWLAIASIVGFGTLSGLVAFHQVGNTTAQTSSGSSKTNSTTTSSSNNSNSFLQQQGGNTGGTSSSSTTKSSTTSSSTSSSSSTPVTGTATS